jgi:aminoglycoside phosphotransferase (APT) family kinase protein
MDIWAENILVDDTGNVSGIVDWDRALWGDPEIEFAVLDYCGVSIPSFWRGYGRERDTSPKARSRGIYYYLYELQKYIVIERARRDNKELADRYKNAALRIAEKI